ncbi:uncharacterized protein SCHCODRAFT_02628123 [Schizophyllum commune H4-8]|uniref:uncharacterized protein n=1 Tax=Schizophyllum commune (strain H4-8 / FGSC 9210) TaxID=578458 RepID=UPI00215EB64F|nr:uncharacterized protein SCHCODRAFT_02628123 [Schizophyllum commune H4-8]KAI5891097.1 hypothetical protein SCHCODRAFT_02628123 [Schizophyllum commune H4-8]
MLACCLHSVLDVRATLVRPRVGQGRSSWCPHYVGWPLVAGVCVVPAHAVSVQGASARLKSNIRRGREKKPGA